MVKGAISLWMYTVCVLESLKACFLNLYISLPATKSLEDSSFQNALMCISLITRLSGMLDSDWTVLAVKCHYVSCIMLEMNNLRL